MKTRGLSFTGESVLIEIRDIVAGAKAEAAFGRASKAEVAVAALGQIDELLLALDEKPCSREAAEGATETG